MVKFRLEKIKNLINKKKPKIIIFNGIGLNKYPTLVYWQEIIGDVPKEIIVGKKRFFFLKYLKNVSFVIVYFLKLIEIKNR